MSCGSSIAYLGYQAIAGIYSTISAACFMCTHEDVWTSTIVLIRYRPLEIACLAEAM